MEEEEEVLHNKTHESLCIPANEKRIKERIRERKEKPEEGKHTHKKKRD